MDWSKITTIKQAYLLPQSYQLAEGPRLVTGELWVSPDGERLRIVRRDDKGAQYSSWYSATRWARTWEEAVAKLEKKRAAQITRLNHQIEQLRRIKFKDPVA